MNVVARRELAGNMYVAIVQDGKVFSLRVGQDGGHSCQAISGMSMAEASAKFGMSEEVALDLYHNNAKYSLGVK